MSRDRRLAPSASLAEPNSLLTAETKTRNSGIGCISAINRFGTDTGTSGGRPKPACGRMRRQRGNPISLTRGAVTHLDLSHSVGEVYAVSSILPPAGDRHFEDYPLGAVFDLGTFTLSEDDIVAFAARYDPQAMHVDRGWAAQGPFGDVIASGWHTVAALMRLIVENFLPQTGLASPGIDELRWLLPVRPGETLRAQVTVTATRQSRSRPDRGLVTSFVELLNQSDEPVLTMRPMNFIRCRPESLASSG